MGDIGGHDDKLMLMLFNFCSICKLANQTLVSTHILQLYGVYVLFTHQEFVFL